ncbi:hypothetical protein Scep_001641 [Stephania cephalantha]|uniref:Uncharacterized protein n=1 Tax=Stephania cephalantha TaxID=152367 RepID=A0AAP0Q3Y8_9MAGN
MKNRVNRRISGSLFGSLPEADRRAAEARKRNGEETLSLVSCVEMDVLTSDDNWLDEEKEESIEELKLNFIDISYDYTTSNDKRVEKEVEVTFERSNESQEESKEDQPLVLVKPLPVPCIHVGFYKGVEEKEHLEIFYIVDTFM